MFFTANIINLVAYFKEEISAKVIYNQVNVSSALKRVQEVMLDFDDNLLFFGIIKLLMYHSQHLKQHSCYLLLILSGAFITFSRLLFPFYHFLFVHKWK